MLDVMLLAGRFVLPESDGRARHIVAFAAGAGITPLLAMIEHGLTTEPETGFTLVYGNRGPDSIMFRRELEDLKDRYLRRFTLLYVLSRNEECSASARRGPHHRRQGQGARGEPLQPGGGGAFLPAPGLGPWIIKETRNALLALGVPRERVHHEFFAPGGGAYRVKAPLPSPRSRGRGSG